MITIENLSKEYKRYTVTHNSLKSFILNWRQHKKNLDNIDMLKPIKNLNLKINESEVFCITGPNGAGKSTLAKLIAGTICPSQGKITAEGRIVPFLELGVAFNPDLTGIDNLYLNGVLLGLRFSYLRKNKNKIFDFAELSEFADTPLKYYSSGMQLRLAFSIAMHAQGDIYIFDEILTVGDSSFQKKCFDSFHDLLKNKKTVIIISHDLDFIKKHANRMLILTHTEHHVINDMAAIDHIYDLDTLLQYCHAEKAVTETSSDVIESVDV